MTLVRPVERRDIATGVTFDIPAGTKLRLTESSGIGKSSLLALLQHRWDPKQGCILLAGCDVRSLSR
ncbi:MAG: hypothetical protein CMF72_25155 [Mameliella sp.]|nr:hypothetical protein [Mameliella sp.]